MNVVKFRLVIIVDVSRKKLQFSVMKQDMKGWKKRFSKQNLPYTACSPPFFLKIRLVLSYRNYKPRHYVTMRDFLLGLRPSFIAARVPGFLLQ